MVAKHDPRDEMAFRRCSVSAGSICQIILLGLSTNAEMGDRAFRGEKVYFLVVRRW